MSASLDLTVATTVTFCRLVHDKELSMLPCIKEDIFFREEAHCGRFDDLIFMQTQKIIWPAYQVVDFQELDLFQQTFL